MSVESHLPAYRALADDLRALPLRGYARLARRVRGFGGLVLAEPAPPARPADPLMQG